jgi:hypothetical protein
MIGSARAGTHRREALLRARDLGRSCCARSPERAWETCVFRLTKTYMDDGPSVRAAGERMWLFPKFGTLLGFTPIERLDRRPRNLAGAKSSKRSLLRASEMRSDTADRLGLEVGNRSLMRELR